METLLSAGAPNAGEPRTPHERAESGTPRTGPPRDPSNSFLETPLLQGAGLLPAIQVGVLVAKRGKGKTHHVSQ